jgi:hypothetical protein
MGLPTHLVYYYLKDKFTLLAKVYFMGIRIKHYSLMMSLAKPFEIQNGANFSLCHSEDVSYPKTRCNG